MSESEAFPEAHLVPEQRSAVYRLLARLWGREIDGGLLSQLREPVMSEAMAGVGLTLDAELAQLSADRALEELAAEYTRLFLGPGPHITPCQSMYAPASGEQPGLIGTPSAATRRFLSQLGLSYDDSYTGLPDAIDVHLDVMGRLAGEEARRRREGDTKGAAKARSIQHQFLTEHLLRFVAPLCRDVRAATSLDLYRSLAEATERFVSLDYGDLMC